MVIHNHVKYLKNMLQPDGDAYPYHELYEWYDEYFRAKQNPSWQAASSWRWEDRYNTLRQNTQFRKNLSYIDELVWESTSAECFLMKLDLHGIRREVANFVVCYCKMVPGRFIKYDVEDFAMKKKANPSLPCPSYMQWTWQTYTIYDSLYEEISNRHLPMLEVDDFMAIEI